MIARLKKVVFGALTVFAVGAVYTYVLVVLKMHIPCLFHAMTGLECPGCGVTGMCLAIRRLDFQSAFYCNRAIFCLLPLMALTAGRMLYVYIRYGRKREKLTQISVYFMIVVLVAFGIWRNLVNFF